MSMVKPGDQNIFNTERTANADSNKAIAVVNPDGSNVTGGTSMVDNAAFTEGGSSVTPIGFEGKDTPGTVTDGRVAIPRLNRTTRIAFAELRDSSGNALDSTHTLPVTINTQTDTVMIGGVNIKEINAVAPLMGNGTTGTGSLRVTVASDNTAFAVNATLQSNTGVDIGKLTANQSVNIAQLAAGTVATGGATGVFAIGGNTATNVVLADNPINTGAQGVSSENAAITAGRKVQLVADLVGKQIVLPYANPENFVSGAATATDTTSTLLIAAPAAGLRNYITHIVVYNSSATNTYIKIQDDSGGTTIYYLPCPTLGGATMTLPTPIRQPTTAKGIYFATNASANAVFISASGYKGV